MATINGTDDPDEILGTPEGDRLNGRDGDDTILGGDGDDTLRGGEGDDILDGGAGEKDQVRYDFDPAGVMVMLGMGTAQDGWGTTDTLSGIEAVRGSRFADVLFGSSEDDELVGDEGDDLIVGGDGDDKVEGGGGNDTLEGGAGNDTLEGGDGVDIARYAGGWSDYILRFRSGELEVETKGDGAEDLLVDMELLEFGDGASFLSEGRVDITALSGAAEISEPDMRALAELYVAYFDRAPDALGLCYWATRLSEGMTLGEIATSFFDQTESRELYPNPSDDAALVDAAYANVLERAADEAGRAYWIAALENGDVSRVEFMLAIINGAKAETGSAEDAAVIADKAGIGLSFAVINGLTDTSDASAAMVAYDRSDASASLAEAVSLIGEFRAAAVEPGSDEIVVEVVGVVDFPFAV